MECSKNLSNVSKSRYMEACFGPNEFAYQRRRGLLGYSNPDDPRVTFSSE
jgi:hypothetical protein